MSRLARAAALVAAAAAILWSGAGAKAQDAPPGDVVEFQVREGVTPFDPGRPVPSGRAAYVEDGAGPADAESGAATADAEGRVRLPFRGPGRTALVWAPGRAPVAVRVNAPIPFFLPLGGALSAEVRVAAATGAAVTGAEVVGEARLPLVHASAGLPDVHRMRVVARTDGAGVARLEGLPDLPISVTVSAEGFVAATAYPVDPRTGTAVVLGRGSRVTGSLRITPSSAALRGAVARLGPRIAPVAPESGAFVFDTVPPGTWELRFGGTGFAPPPPRTLVVEDGVDRSGIDVAAFAASRFRGRASVAGGGAVPPLRLSVVYPPETGLTPAERSVEAGADGRFAAEDLAPCDGAVVTVAADGFVAARAEGVSLPPGDASRETEVVLRPAASVRGVLADLDGERLGGAVVAAVLGPPPFRREWSRATALPDGSFSLDGIPEGETWIRVVGRPVGGEARAGPFTVKASETTDVGVLRVFAGYALSGRVSGAPAGTVVVVSRDGGDLATATVEGEAWRADGLTAGPVDVRAEHDGEAGGTTRASLPGAWPVSLAWEGPVDVRGRVLDADGRPVVTGILRASRTAGGGARAVDLRDPTGAFTLRLARGRWRLEAEDGAGAGAVRELVVPGDAAAPQVLVVERGASIRGVLAAAEDGHALEGAVVTALVAGDRGGRAVARSDAGGGFRLVGVPEGAVRVRIETSDRGALETDPRVVRAGDETDLGRVEVPRGTAVRGEVVRGGATPLAGAEVTFECDGGTRRVARTDEYGRFAAAGLPRGGAVVRVRDDGGAVLRTQRFDVPPPWDEWRLRIDVAEGTRVAGRVTTGGRPEAFARVVLRTSGRDAAEVAAVADAQGRFALPPVPAGDGEFEVRVAGASDGATGWRRGVRVRLSTDQREDLDLPEASVGGRVEAFEGGGGVAGAFVELRAAGEAPALVSAVTSSDGAFTLPRVAPGTYDLVARRAGHGPAWVRGVVVRPKRDTDALRVVLPVEGRVLLRVVDSRLQGVSTAWARATPAGATRDGPLVAAEADADGRIAVRGLSRGPWRIVVGAPGRATRTLGVVAVEEGERDAGDVTLDRGAVLRVEALIGGWGGGARSRRFGGLHVEVRDVYGLDPRPPQVRDDPLRGGDPQYVTGTDGRIEVPGLAPGAYDVFPAGRPDAAVRVRLREGSVTTVMLPVPPVPDPRGVSDR